MPSTIIIIIIMNLYIAMLYQLRTTISAIKVKLRGICIHEAMHNSSELCPKVVADKVHCDIKITR